MSRTPVPLPPPIVVDGETLRDLDAASRLEWLEADGRGGFASGTVAGANTRRYHGLLVVADKPPADRIVIVSRIEETVAAATGERFELATNFYGDVVHPRGYALIESFFLDPWPTWRYRLGDLRLTREIFASREAGATVLRYRLEGGGATLEARPLIAGRPFHSLSKVNGAIRAEAEASERLVTYAPYDGIPAVMLSFDEGEWAVEGNWYFHTVYPRETERALGDREDLYCPGVLRVPLRDGASTVIACGTRPASVAASPGWVSAELLRRGAAAQHGRDTAGEGRLTELGAWLAMAADAFVVEGSDSPVIIAGYPWFGEWARDTAIALPGLCLTTGRIEQAGAILRRLASTMDGGLLVNRLPDRGEAPAPDDYNAVDAPLWFIETAARAAESGLRIPDLMPVIASILDAYEHGTRFGIGLRPDGLVHHGAAGVALTWMDARVDGAPVTPRSGAAVEVNALWYNALLRAAAMTDSRARARHWHGLAERCREGFEAFWYAPGGYLYDVLGPDGGDPALRPNQLFAVSLAFSPLDRERARSVVDVVERELVVPCGVRTLSPRHIAYRGRFAGTLRERDHAYHSGTAWPWLLGPFGHALLAAHGRGPGQLERVRATVGAFERHLLTHGIGQVAEVVSGDAPHAPGGCIAQAWSCGELLRLLATLRDAAAGTD